MNCSLRPTVATLAACFLLAAAGFAQSPQVLVFDGGHDDRGNALATDATGALFVGGHSNVDSSPVGFVVLKYNPLGSLLWQGRPTGLGDYTASTASALATDAAGNVYAAGYAMKPLPFFQNDFGIVVTSFDPNGAQRWAQVVNGPANSRDTARGVALHPTQGLYVTGITDDAFGRSDWITVRYSLTGVEQWRRIEPGSGNTDDQPVAVKVDAAGNAIVAGWVQVDSISGPHDLRVVKYDPQGNVLWRADYSDTAISDELPTDLAIDAAGNIYVTADRGISTNPELSFTPVTVKYDANGNRLYVLAGQGGSSVALDGSDNPIVSGTESGDAGSNVVDRTAKLTPAGTVVWSQPYTSLNLGVDDVSGNVFLTRGYSYTVVKLSAAGQLQWEFTVPNGSIASSALVDPATGDFIVSGTSSNGNGNILTARFAANGTPVPPPPPGPNAPSALGATAKKGSIALAWTDNATNESGFRIERSANGGAFTQIAQVGANVKTYTNSGTTKNVTYGYRVRAFNAQGDSAYSNTATAVGR